MMASSSDRGWGRTAVAAVAATCALALTACGPLPQRAGIPTRWEPSPNHNERRPVFVVLHHTGDDTAAQALRTLSDPLREVSAHYLVGRDGTIWQLVDERARAWHAGTSWWGGNTDLNSSSLGIELDNNGREPFPEPQIAALLRLLDDIRSRHRIPRANVIGHADVAPRRKVDPSRHFPWRRLALAGHGLWCDSPPPLPPEGFDAAQALQALGYDVRRVDAAVAAFKLHYVQDGSGPPLTLAEEALLDCLVRMKREAEDD